MKKLLPFVLSLLACAFVSCEKDYDGRDLTPNITVIDAEVALVEYYVTLSEADLSGSPEVLLFCSTKGDPKNPSNTLAEPYWTFATMEQGNTSNVLSSGRHYYGYWSQNLVPGTKYYVRVRLKAGGEEHWGSLGTFQMPLPGEPYVRSSDLQVESTYAVATATWGANGQTIASTGYIISDNQEEIDKNEGTVGNVSMDGKYHFDDLTPGKTYYTKLWCQTKMPEHPTQYHKAAKTYSSVVSFTTPKASE